MQKSEVLAALEILDRRTNDDWLTSLEERKIKELTFHDTHRSSETHALEDNKKYYSTARAVNVYVDQWISRNSRGKIFLDYACGIGDATIKSAQAGADLAIGLDISGFSVQCGRKRAAELGCSNIFFVQGDCEDTKLPANSIDTILCQGMLHHLDLSHAIPEIRRILKPGGRCLALEALNYNPAMKLYRMMTPELRTDWEKRHILSLREVRFIGRFMTVENVQYWILFSLLATPFRNTKHFDSVLRMCTRIDSGVLRVWPLKFLAWMFSFEMVKPPRET